MQIKNLELVEKFIQNKNPWVTNLNILLPIKFFEIF